MHTDMHIHAYMSISHAPLIIYLCWKLNLYRYLWFQYNPCQKFIWGSLFHFLCLWPHPPTLSFPACLTALITQSVPCVYGQPRWRCRVLHHASLWFLLPSFSWTPWCSSLCYLACARVPPSHIFSAAWNFTFLLNHSARNKKMGEGKDSRFSDISLYADCVCSWCSVGSLSRKLMYLFYVNECFTYMYVNIPCACLWKRLIEVFLFVIFMRRHPLLLWASTMM